MNYLEKLIAIIVALVIIFFIPASYFIIKKDSVIQINVEYLSENLTERAAIQGYITKVMYESYLKELLATGKLYGVELEHIKIAHEPEYRIRTSDEIIAEDESLWIGSNEFYAEPVSTELPLITDPISGGTADTDTNASVLASAINTPASAGHVHNASCYNGTIHTHTGNSSVPGGCYGGSGTTLNSYCGTYTNYFATEYQLIYSCNKCSYNISNWQFTATASKPYACSISGCTGTVSCTNTMTHVYYLCSNCSNSSSESYGATHNRSITSYPLICGKTDGLYYNGNTVVSPNCDKQVTAIAPTHSVQTVYRNDPLVTTVLITHLDGSIVTVAGTTTFSTGAVCQNQLTTITYTYSIDGAPQSKICTISVTVIPKSKTCVNGHVYNLNSDASDPGCPYCRGWLRSLSVFVPSSGQLTIYRNPADTLEMEGVGLLAVYQDGHREYVYNGYADNLDPDYVGNQTVTIGYKGLTTSLPVTVLRNKKKCDVCGLFYELQLDDQDKGCPYCKARVPIFTGNVMKYEAGTYEEEIITELYEGSGIYYFRRGDTFSVRVSSSDKLGFVSFISGILRLKIQVYSTDTVKDEVTK